MEIQSIQVTEKIKSTSVGNASQIAKIINSILDSEPEIQRDKEHFYTIGLNARLVIQYIELVSLGTLNASLVHPREVFRNAIRHGVAQIIIVHNHPSGESEPSLDDVTMTHKLRDAGKIISIELMRHKFPLSLNE